MTDKIKYVRDIQIIKSEDEPGIVLIKAIGLAEIRKLVAPVLIPGKNNNISEEGIYELDFRLDSAESVFINVDLEVDVELRIKNLPQCVKAVKINASENCDIELI
jgi:hypothetical protein